MSEYPGSNRRTDGQKGTGTASSFIMLFRNMDGISSIIAFLLMGLQKTRPAKLKSISFMICKHRMTDMAIISNLAEALLLCLKKRRERYRRRTKVTADVAVGIRKRKFSALKQEKYLNHAVLLPDGADPIRVIYRMHAEEHMKRRKDIIGDLFDLKMPNDYRKHKAYA